MSAPLSARRVRQISPIQSSRTFSIGFAFQEGDQRLQRGRIVRSDVTNRLEVVEELGRFADVLSPDLQGPASGLAAKRVEVEAAIGFGGRRVGDRLALAHPGEERREPAGA